MRVVVTGPRDFDCYYVGVIDDTIARFHEKYGSDLIVIDGEARGVDRIVTGYCLDRRIVTNWYPADWAGPCDLASGMCQPGHRKTRMNGTEYCPSAGIRRNEIMATRARVELGLAFIDKPLRLCRGTSDMVNRLKAHGVPYAVIDCVKGETVETNAWLDTNAGAWSEAIVGLLPPVRP